MYTCIGIRYFEIVVAIELLKDDNLNYVLGLLLSRIFEWIFPLLFFWESLLERIFLVQRQLQGCS